MADENKEPEVVVAVPDAPDPAALASDGQVLAAIATLSTQVAIGLETVNARIDALVSQPPPPPPEPEPEPVIVVAETKEETKAEGEEEKKKDEPKRRKAWLD